MFYEQGDWRRKAADLSMTPTTSWSSQLGVPPVGRRSGTSAVIHDEGAIEAEWDGVMQLATLDVRAKGRSAIGLPGQRHPPDHHRRRAVPSGP